MIVTVTSPICLKFQNDTLQRLQFRLQAIPGQRLRYDQIIQHVTLPERLLGLPAQPQEHGFLEIPGDRLLLYGLNPSADWHLLTCVRRERMSNGRDTT